MFYKRIKKTNSHFLQDGDLVLQGEIESYQQDALFIEISQEKKQKLGGGEGGGIIQ